MNRILVILGLIAFASSISLRIIDPVVPLIARDFLVATETAALLSTAVALPYALSQLILGPLGDVWGKERVILSCLVVMVFALFASLFAPNFTTLFGLRILTGVAGGGMIPVALALVGDRFPVKDRQVALSRVMFCTVLGTLLGGIASGFVGQAYGWRMPIWGSLAIGLVAFGAAFHALRSHPGGAEKVFSLSVVRDNYARVLANPKAAICFIAVFAEGAMIYGAFPHLAALLEARGTGGPTEAGIAIGAFAVGGMALNLFIPILLRHVDTFAAMRIGGVIAGSALLVVGYSYEWQIAALAFGLLGFGFYMMHTSLQAQATELSPTARGSAMALHACSFFTGIASGAPLFGLGYFVMGPGPTTCLAGAICALTGFMASRALAARTNPSSRP